MLLGQYTHTLGDKRRRVVNYKFFLEPGKNSITAATATADKADVTISAVRVIDGQKVEFFAAGGSLSEVFTVTVQITLRTTETVTDTIQYTVVAA